MQKILIICLTFSFPLNVMIAQQKTLTGRTISAFLEPTPWVQIMIQDTIEVGYTDENGYFQVEIPISEKNISFSFVGMNQASIGLVETCDELEVILMPSFSYCFISLKRAERKRKKRFKKLPKIHQEAFEKGLFEQAKPCFAREFQPLPFW